MARRKARSARTQSVYHDLGYPDADDMLVKAQLTHKLSQIVGDRGFTQSEAALKLGIAQPKLSRLFRGEFRGISERKLMDCLTRLGSSVEIVVRTPDQPRKPGTVTVRFA